METVNSDITSSSMVTNPSHKPSDVGSSSANTMDSFQDGGQQNINSSEFAQAQNMDGAHINSDLNSYPQGSGDQNVPGSNYSKMNDSMASSQMSGYNSAGYRMGGYSMNEHGGMGSGGGGDFAQQNDQFNQFGQPNYPPHPRGPGIPGPGNRPGSGGGQMSGMPHNYGHNQPRFAMSGPNIQQQGGPTPTLNQLLQNTNSNPKYQGGYDYNMPPQKGGPGTEMPSSQGFNNPQGWGGQQRPGMGGYPSPMQQQGGQPYRNQGQMYDRRPPNMPMPSGFPGGSQQQTGPGGQYGSQFSPNSRTSMQQQQAGGRPGQLGGMGSYNNQMPNQFNSQMGYGSGQPSSQYMQHSQQSQSYNTTTPHQQQNFTTQSSSSSSSSSQPAGNVGIATTSGSFSPSIQPSPNHQQQPPQPSPGQPSPQQQQQQRLDGPQQDQVSTQSRDKKMPSGPLVSPLGSPQAQENSQERSSAQSPDEGGVARSTTSTNSSSNSSSESTPTSKSIPTAQSSSSATTTATGSQQQQHPNVSSLRPIPSPGGGSVGSRSNTPASLSGNQGSPMPPRPPSNNQEVPNRIQSPMANQGGYGQQMMPPPMGQVSQMGYTPNKMQQQQQPNMMGQQPQPQQQMPPYNNQYPNQAQGNYGRGLQGYSNPPQNQFNNQNMYGNNMGMTRGPVGNNSYPNQYPGPQSMGMREQYGNFPSQGGMSPGGSMPGQGMPNSQGMTPNSSMSPKGAQAAAQAAMITAASQHGSGQKSAPGLGGPQQQRMQQRPGMYQQYPQQQQQQPPQQQQQQQQPQQHVNQMNYNNSGMNQLGVENQGAGPGQNGPPGYGPVGGASVARNSMGMPMNGPSEMTNQHTMSGGNVSLGPNANSMNHMGSVATPNMPVAAMPNNNMAMPNMGRTTPNNSAAPSSGSPRPQPCSSAGPNTSASGTVPDGMANSSIGGDASTDNHDMKTPVSLAHTNAGDTSTSVTQSVSSPVPTATESKSSMPDTLQGVLGAPADGDTHMRPPPAQMQNDNGSDEKQKLNKQDSQSNASGFGPSTPASVAPSPTMSSMPDEFENISSPSWPGTPVSSQKPAVQNNEVLTKQCEMGEEPDRRPFLERLFHYMEERGSPININPSISKTPVDLYKLYHLVRERGGLWEVTKNKKWREVSGILTIGVSSSAGFTLRKNYCKLVFPFECKFDRGGIDPAPVIAQLESMSKKDSKKNRANAQNASEQFRGAPSPGFNAFPGAPGMQRAPSMPNADMGPMMPPNVSMMPNQNMPPYDQSGNMMGPGPGNGMMGNSMMPGQGMGMPTGMPGNSGMMPNSSMPNSNNMMPNSSLHNSMGGAPGPMGMPGRPMMPNSSEGMQDGFATNSMGSQFPRSMNSQMPGYSNTMNQAQPGMNSYGNFGSNRPPGMPPMSQYGSGPQGMGPGQSYGPDSMNRPNSRGEPYGSDPYSKQPGVVQQQDAMAASRTMPGDGIAFSVANTSQYNNTSMANASNAATAVSTSSITGDGGSRASMQTQLSQPQTAGPQQPASQPSPAPTPPQQQLQQQHQQAPLPQPQQPPQHPSVAPSNMGSQRPPSASSTPGLVPGPVPSQVPGPGPGPSQEQGYAGRFPNQMPPNRSQTPQEQPAVSSQAMPSQVAPTPNFQGPGPRPYHQPQGPEYSGYGPPQQPSMGQQSPYPPKPYNDYTQKETYMQSYGHSQPHYGERSPMMGQYGPSAQYGHHRPNMGVPTPQDNMQTGDMRTPVRDQQQPQPQWGVQRFPGSNPSQFSGPTSSMSPMPPTTAYSGAIYNQRPGLAQHRMGSPQRPDNKPPYMPQPAAKAMPPKQPSMGTSSFPVKKDLVFPPDSVEATHPQLAKRKKLAHKDIGQVDPWRVMMSLKSGLLAESTWALNVLSILLFDDSTVMYFGLQHMPGLIEVLLDHFRRCLTEIFGDSFEEMEIGIEKREVLRKTLAAKEASCVRRRRSSSNSSSGSTSDLEEDDGLFAPKSPPPFTVPDPERLSQPDNYTLKTRSGREVKIEKRSELSDIMFDDKLWDVYVDFNSGSRNWQLGFGDISVHVLTHFSSESSFCFHRRQFYRKHRCKKAVAHNEEDKENQELQLSDVKDSERRCTTEFGNTDSHVNDCADAPQNEDKCCSDTKPKENGSKTTCPSDNKCAQPKNSGCASQNLEKCSSDVACSVDIKKEPVDTLCMNVDTDDVKAELMDCSERNCGRSPETAKEVKVENSATSPDNNIKKEITNKDVKLVVDFRSRLGPVNSDIQTLGTLKRKWEEFDGEDMEAAQADQPSLSLISESQIEVSRRCICISNIFRSLSFIPGNEPQFASHHGLMLVLGKLLLLHHVHPKLRTEQNKFEREVENDAEEVLMDTKEEWWWDCLHALRENVLVIFANICGRLKMNVYPEEICLPVLDGLLHWAMCPSSYAQDPMSSNSVLSPQRLVLEALCKLCVTETNVDLLLATPPFSRIVHLLTLLVKMLADRSEQVMREFAINLLASFVQSDSAARAVALQHPAISLLLEFVESAEQQAMQIANSHGVNMLRENPEMMGTSLDMLRRAANILLCLARVPDNRPLFMQYQQRMLSLVMSQILDQHVASIISDVLYNCSQGVEVCS